MSDKKTTLQLPPKNGGWGITTDDKAAKLVCNFQFEVLSVVDVLRIPEAKLTPHVKLKLCFSLTEYIVLAVPISELEKINWLEKDTRCILYLDVAPAKAQRYIANKIREKLPGGRTEILYKLCKVGLHIINGEPVFCTGGAVIRPPHADTNRLVIEPDEIRYTLDTNPDITEVDAIADMYELLNLFPDIGRVLLAYNLMCLMRELYAFAWEPPQFCLFVYGESDAKKTTLCTFMSQLYNRNRGREHPLRFDSTLASLVRDIYLKSDCAIIFDDLCPLSSLASQRKQENTLEDVVRIIGDGVQPGRVNLADPDMERPPPKVGMVFTGEYLFTGNLSTAVRMLPIEISIPSDETLQKMAVFRQEKSLSISSLYYNFIQWIITNYDWVRDSLKEWWTAYSTFASDIIGMNVHSRLRQAHYNLSTAYTMFLEYCTEKGFITEGEAMELYQSFLHLLTDLVQAQQARADQSKPKSAHTPNTMLDPLAHIRKLHSDGAIRLAPSAKEFDEAQHDGVIHLNRLYIYGERFRNYIASAGANLDKALDSLDARGALVRLDNDRTVQLVTGNGKRRCYAIFMTHLK